MGSSLDLFGFEVEFPHSEWQPHQHPLKKKKTNKQKSPHNHGLFHPWYGEVELPLKCQWFTKKNWHSFPIHYLYVWNMHYSTIWNSPSGGCGAGLCYDATWCQIMRPDLILHLGAGWVMVVII